MKELQFHLDQHVADLIAGGVDPAEGRRQARMALGELPVNTSRRSRP